MFRDPAAPEPAVYTQGAVLGTGWTEAFEGLALCSYFTFGAAQAVLTCGRSSNADEWIDGIALNMGRAGLL